MASFFFALYIRVSGLVFYQEFSRAYFSTFNRVLQQVLELQFYIQKRVFTSASFEFFNGVFSSFSTFKSIVISHKLEFSFLHLSFRTLVCEIT